MSEMTVGCIRTTVMPQQSGIYEALLEKAERERDHWKRMYEEADWKTVEAETYKKELMETRKDRNKWGFYGEKMQQERDHYKQALEEVSSSIEDWLNSPIQEPSLDFIHAIKAWADKKLKEI